MPIVNYVREHMRFIEYASDERLTGSERLLWYALMHIMNQRAQGHIWPDEFIRISNDRLLTYCPMRFDTMAAARNSLKQKGLIDYTPGKKNKESPAYRMIYFFPTYVSPSTEQDMVESNPIFTDNMGDNIGGNMGDNIGGNNGDNMGDIYINNKDIPMSYQNQSNTDEDEEEERARAREAVRLAYANCFGLSIPALIDETARIGLAYGFGPSVISAAIRVAAMSGAKNPLNYLRAMFEDMESCGVSCVPDFNEYAALKDALNGNDRFITQQEARERLDELRRRKRDAG